MNVYTARQMGPMPEQPDAGRWRYTCRNDRFVWAVGYCGDVRECPDCHGESFHSRAEPCDTCRSKGAVTIPAGERCPGHDTPEEACAHQRAYEIDRAVKAMERGRVDRYKRRCPCEADGCDKRTPTAVDIGPGIGSPVFLCEAHLTREGLESAVEEIGEVWSS